MNQNLSILERIKVTISNIASLIRTNKKLSLFFIALGFLLLFLTISIVSFFINRSTKQETDSVNPKTPSLPLTQLESNRQEKKTLARFTIVNSVPKPSYKVGETIAVKIMADSDSNPVTAADILITFDPTIVKLETETNLVSQNFFFHRRIRNNLIYLTLLQKPNTKNQIFQTTPIFELKFKTVKSGTTSLTMILTPNQKDESNLLTKDSTDILTHVFGTEIIIE